MKELVRVFAVVLGLFAFIVLSGENEAGGLAWGVSKGLSLAGLGLACLIGKLVDDDEWGNDEV
jgi:hypothetical protein